MVMINIMLCMTGLVLFSTSAWLSNLPDDQLPLKLFQPLFLSFKITLTAFGILLLITCSVGLSAAARVKRYTTAMVSYVLGQFRV